MVFATDKQVRYLRALINERDLFADTQIFDAVNAMDVDEFEAWKAVWIRDVEGYSVSEASRWIDRLRGLERRPVEDV